MIDNAAPTPLISEKWEFSPSVGVREYTQKLEEAEKIVKDRLESLEQYQGIPGLDFLHRLDELVDFVATQVADATLWLYYHPDDDMRKAGESASAVMERLDLRISSSPRLAQHLSKVNVGDLDKDSQRFLAFSLRNARRAGASLGKGDHERFLAISNELQDTQRRYMQRIVEDNTCVSVDSKVLATMPADFQKSHPVDPATGLITVSTKGSDASTFARFCEDDRSAEKFWMACLNRNPENEDDLRLMVELRYQQAKILGYPSFPHYAMEVGMVSDPRIAREITLATNEKTKASSEQEKSDLSEILEAKGRKLNAWTWQNANQLLLRDRFPDYDPLEARKYFPLGKVILGAMNLLGRILSVEFRQIPGIETWHPTVQVYDVFDLRPSSTISTGENGICHGDGALQSKSAKRLEPERLGRLFVDLITRDNKSSHPCMMQLRSKVPGSACVPSVSLGGSLAPDEKAFLNFRQCRSVLHELGHCVHGLLAQQTSYYRFQGVNNEIDFVETPSQLLEEVLVRPEVLEKIAVNDSGQVIPRKYLDALVCEDEFTKAIVTRWQNVFALCSLDLHVNLDAKGKFIGETAKVCESICEAYCPFGPLPRTNRQHTFEHLVNYDCRYYTYQHSLVIVKDLASKFLRCVPNDPDDIGLEYRRTILEPGSSVDATDLVKNFLGRDSNMEAFYRWAEGRSLLKV
ncbi:hypothetical protein QFC22_002528 [Naganishia vaughanmartiniae]|uniref:Uncharacterized protein n=1 Tax=Naganishia vaughanmartiniae TaxID=1424756 RepID=A0ACC2XB54_9TREE|nr:hypothetical protein QFC22_002528 [Naganishia vaughanmartiniae]